MTKLPYHLGLSKVVHDVQKIYSEPNSFRFTGRLPTYPFSMRA